MRKRKQDLTGIPNLFTFTKVKQNSLTITGASVLRLLPEHYNQTQIAVKIGTSKQVVHYWVRKLEKLGLWINPKTKKVKQIEAGGVPIPPFDVRFRSLKWILSKPVKLPFDDRTFNNGLEQRIWKVKDCLVRVNLGSQGGYSLEIEAGYCGGNSPDECNHKHDSKCLRLFEWLSEHFSDLKEYSGKYTVNRPGELQVLAFNEQAKQILEARGGGVVKLGNPPIAKIDQSRGYPEFQLLLENLATKQEINQILEIQKQQLELTQQTNELTKQTNELFRELLGNVRKIEKPPSDIIR